jgi:hypothetical protein
MDGIDIDQDNYLTDLTFKGNLEYAYNKEMSFLFGFEQKNLHAVFLESFPGGLVDVDAHRTHYVSYFQTNWKPTSRWDIKTGLRYNYFNSNKDYQNIDPRLAVKYRLSETTNLKFATGMYHQYLHRIPMAFITSIWTSSDKYQKEASSGHIILGFQKEISDNFSLDVETYYKTYRSINQFNQNFLTEIYAKDFTENGETIYNDTQALFDHGRGNSLGFEVLIKKEMGSITGWLGYTLGRTKHLFEGINQNENFPPRHDRTSVFNMVANINLRNFLREIRGQKQKEDRSHWLLGVNFVYTTGQPITVPSSVYVSNTLPDIGGTLAHGPGGFSTFSLYPTDINAYRLPAYSRLDLSITYKKQYKSWSLSPFFQIFNIGNRKNVWFIQYEDDSTREKIVQKIETQNMLPLLPTLGVNINF